ncbi:hypothetical protein QBC47DRAFT_122624 [Echria macrotheca]|uniref:Uncharacterized protein n=1 Tax=Echria macrotheca TaxID=438768 RepID=A0AAJ0F4D4_9PEZI|nr:hypothetical protein QBC47DRAFT_122624 [Echria macrotheca]
MASHHPPDASAASNGDRGYAYTKRQTLPGGFVRVASTAVTLKQGFCQPGNLTDPDRRHVRLWRLSSVTGQPPYTTAAVPARAFLCLSRSSPRCTMLLRTPDANWTVSEANKTRGNSPSLGCQIPRMSWLTGDLYLQYQVYTASHRRYGEPTKAQCNSGIGLPCRQKPSTKAETKCEAQRVCEDSTAAIAVHHQDQLGLGES